MKVFDADVVRVHAVVKYKKVGLLRFLSAIETANAIERNFRRAGAHMAFSQGFHRKPKISFLDPTPTGVFNLALYVRVEMKGHEPDLLKRLKLTSVRNLEPVRIWWAEEDPNKLVSGYLFRVILPSKCVDLSRFDPEYEVNLEEKGKKGKMGEFFNEIHFEKIGKFIVIVYSQSRNNVVRARYLYEPLLVESCEFVLVQRLRALCGQNNLDDVLEAKAWAVEY